MKMIRVFRLALLLTLLINPAQSYAATVTTKELGWSAGQDISQELANIFNRNTIRAGDTLVFSANYTIQGNTSVKLPNSVTLIGNYFGAGLTVRNTEPETRNGVLQLGDGNTLYNFSVEYRDTLPVPPLSAGITSQGKSNTRGILAFADNVTVSNSSFRGNVGIHIDVSGENFRVLNSHFDGGSNHIRWLGRNVNHNVSGVLFENALGDGIKTVRGSEFGTDNARVRNSVFLNNRRDGIDTTGGFSNSTVTSSYFVNLFKGMDIKNIFDSQTQDPTKGGLNRNITVRDSTFVNVNNGIAAITLDRGNSNGDKWVTNANADQLLTQKIQIENSVFEASNGRSTRAILAEDVHTLNWRDLVLIGTVDEDRIKRNSQQSSAVDLSVNTNYNISGVGTQRLPSRSAKPDSFYRALAGPDESLRFSELEPITLPAIMMLLDEG